MTGLILVALIPFAALGIAHGPPADHGLDRPGDGRRRSACSRSSAAPGSRSPAAFLHDIAQALPSYWLVQASHVALGGTVWGATGWLVVAAWTVVLSAFAVWAYQRDTKRV